MVYRRWLVDNCVPPELLSSLNVRWQYWCRIIPVECVRFGISDLFVGDVYEIDPRLRLCVCENMCLFRGRVCRNMIIGVGCLLSILYGRLEFARILSDLSCLFLWLVLRTSGFYDGFGLGCNFLCRSLLANLFAGGLTCLCCVPDPLVEMHTSVFRDWVFCSNYIWAFLDSL